MSYERLPSLTHPQPSHAYSSGASSPRLGSVVSSTGSYNGSQSSFTTVASSNGPKTPSPSLPTNAITGPATSIVSYDAMNQGQGMYYPHQMSAGQQQPPQTVTSSGLAQYPHHSMMHSAPAQYGSQPPASYPYGYANGMTSPGAAQHPVANGMPTPQTTLPLPSVSSQGGLQQQQQFMGFDATGQQPPPGMKPRVTATLWEDEGSLCFQVEARGICVARREDNHMINGTKLLNVAGMTRGRRDGILKSEKIRHVVKIGPMHLKGVWIPYERALEFANKEKITELLYPLFVHNIGAMLYQPGNASRTNQMMAASDRRKQEQGQIRNPPTQGLPSIQQQSQPSHAMAQLPGPQGTLASQSPMSRPGLERAHTFPTPPASATGVIGGMGGSENFNWQGQGMNGQQGNNPLPIDASLSNTRSMPATPATTPPSGSVQSMPAYAPNGQSYDAQRPIYNAASSQPSPYQNGANDTQDRLYGQNSSYAKSEMAPPAARSANQSGEQDVKTNGVISQDASGQPPGEEESEQDPEYTHNNNSYRNSYNYTAPGVSALTNDTNLSPEMTGSPNHPPASGRATPRTAAAPQGYYQTNGYNTPPRVQQSSNLYNVMSNERGSTNGTPANDVYAPAPDMNNSMQNGYASQQPMVNGSAGSLKRGRDDDAQAEQSMDLKRRRTMMESSVSAPVYDAMSRPASTVGVSRGN